MKQKDNKMAMKGNRAKNLNQLSKEEDEDGQPASNQPLSQVQEKLSG